MEDLEGCANAMEWDWDMDDIDVDEDNRKQWLPMMPQMMKNVETLRWLLPHNLQHRCRLVR